jgi:gamma-glutamyltranspeptidase/glutathione hydrolase
MPFVAAIRRAALGAALALLATAAQADGPGRAAIASPHAEATAAARQVLEQGGNAFDAAVAIGAALAVVEPYGSGPAAVVSSAARTSGHPTLRLPRRP